MDPSKKSQSFYDHASIDDEYAVAKTGLYQSHTFSCGLNNRDSFHDFSEFKSSIDQISKQETIKEEENSDTGKYLLCQFYINQTLFNIFQFKLTTTKNKSKK